MKAFTNTHLSYSRLSRFEQCPLSFKLQYIDKRAAEPGMPLRFGKVVHATLERLLAEAVDQEQTGPLDEDHALDLFARAWADDRITGSQEFGEGVAMVRAFVRAQGVVDHRDVLGIEREFRLPVGRFTVLGFIDRVNRVDDETIEVVDYKTNRQLFTRDEVEQSLQMSLYEIAVRRLWPWAKHVRLTFDMLRHGVRQTTTRTPEQLEAALRYVETLGRMTEEATDFPARVGGGCVHCDHRAHCPAYGEALKGKRIVLGADPSELESVAREREEVAHLAKILYARKSELETVLRAHLADREDLVLAGMRYALVPTSAGVTYPTGRTLQLLEERTGLPRDTILERVAVIDRESLDRLVRDAGKNMEKSRVTLLRAELDAMSERTMTTRFTAKEMRS
jgi:putative RecB family exonuclease